MPSNNRKVFSSACRRRIVATFAAKVAANKRASFACRHTNSSQPPAALTQSTLQNALRLPASLRDAASNAHSRRILSGAAIRAASAALAAILQQAQRRMVELRAMRDTLCVLLQSKAADETTEGKLQSIAVKTQTAVYHAASFELAAKRVRVLLEAVLRQSLHASVRLRRRAAALLPAATDAEAASFDEWLPVAI